MNSVFIITLSTIIPILALILALGIFLLYKKSERNRFERKLTSIIKDLKLERETYFNAMINRVDLVTKANPKFKDLNKKTGKIYHELIGVINDTRLVIRNIKHELRSNRFSPSSIKKQMDVCISKQVKLENLATEFKAVSSSIIQQDDFVRNEFNFYQTQFRKVSEVYTSKSVQLMRLKDPIEKLLAKAKKAEKEFDKAITVSKVKEADRIVKIYSTYIVKMIKVVSEGVATETYLYKTIPQTSLAIDTKYKQLKKQLKSSLEHIKYVETMKLIYKSFEKAKKYHQELNMDKCKKFVIKTLKGFKSLENIFNFEIKCRKDFYDNFNKTIHEIKRVLKHYVEIKKQYKSELQNSRKINEDIIAKFNDLTRVVNELDKDAISFGGLKTDTKLPYSVKKSRMEMILGQTKWTLKVINEFLERLWALNIDSSLIKNKFNRSEAAINELIVNLKVNTIVLNENESMRLNELDELKGKIAIAIQTGKQYEVVKDITKFSTSTTEFYNLVSGKYEIALHVKNMLKELAPMRANNDKLNFELKVAEKNYLEGKYAAALNGIIEVISEGVK